MKKKTIFKLLLIGFVFLTGIVLVVFSESCEEKVLGKYKKEFSIGDDISKVESFFVKRGIKYETKAHEDLTELFEDQVSSKFQTALIFNAYSNRGSWKSVFGQTDVLINVWIDAEGKVIGVSSKEISTFF